METSGAPEALPDFSDGVNGKMPARRLEYFWLCEDCARRMTLTFEKGVGITTRALARSKKAAG